MSEIEFKLKILDYYKSDKFKPTLPDFSNFRHYRGKSINGVWIKCHRKITSPDQLKRWITDNKIIDCYYSTSKWLDPRNISDNNPKRASDQILLGADLVFDVDRDFSIGGLRKALIAAKRIFKFASPKLELETLCFTGMKGFRLIFNYPLSLRIDLGERLKQLRKKRKVYIKQLPKNIKFDKDCTVDIYRIIRVLGTVHGETGLVCTELDKSSLHKSFEEVLPYLKNYEGKQADIPNTTMKKTTKQSGKCEITIERPDKPLKASYITNQVGKDRFVPFFKINIHNINKFAKVILKYDIGPLWFFVDYDSNSAEYVVMGIKTFQRARLLKIYSKFKSSATNEFKKYKRQYFKVTPEMEYCGHMRIPTKSFCSLSHFLYLHSRKLVGMADADNYTFHRTTQLTLTHVKYKS